MALRALVVSDRKVVVVGQATSIEWTDFSSNPLRYRDAAGKVVWACAKVSAGCAHCYSEAIAHRYRKGGPFSLAQVKKVTPFIDEKECRRLLTSRKLSGKRVFIGDMTDVFGEWLPFEMLDRLFAVFALRPDVTFQILTKRPERMSEYLNAGRGPSNAFGWHFSDAQRRVKAEADEIAEDLRRRGVDASNWNNAWPLPNVWLGTSCEDQEAADKRIYHLRTIDAVVRFISCEPLLGPIRLQHGFEFDGKGGMREREYLRSPGSRCINWVIIGGESGPGARPCNIDWIRSLIAQCKAAQVPCFVKQLGSRPYYGDVVRPGCSVRVADEPLDLTDRKGGDPAEWPADLNVREFPDNPRSVTGGFVGSE